MAADNNQSTPRSNPIGTPTEASQQDWLELDQQGDAGDALKAKKWTTQRRLVDSSSHIANIHTGTEKEADLHKSNTLSEDLLQQHSSQDSTRSEDFTREEESTTQTIAETKSTSANFGQESKQAQEDIYQQKEQESIVQSGGSSELAFEERFNSEETENRPSQGSRTSNASSTVTQQTTPPVIPTEGDNTPLPPPEETANMPVPPAGAPLIESSTPEVQEPEIVIESSASSPTLTTSDSQGKEDTAVVIDISASLTDTDGSESLSITIDGIPENATLSAGRNLGNGTWELTAEELKDLTLTPPADSDEDFSLTITVTSTESHGEAQTSVVEVIDVFLESVADAPVLTTDQATGEEDTAISLDISAALTDIDGSESLSSIIISNIPDGASLSAGTENHDGSWALSQQDLDGLTITPQPDNNDDFELNISVTATDTNGSTATTQTILPVSIEAIADKAIITGDGSTVTEDATTSVSGQLAIVDPDRNEDHFTAESIQGIYGDFEINESGSWTYTLNNETENVQELREGQVTDDSITITSADGTEHQLTFAVTGSNDVPVLDITSTATVAEDGSKTISFETTDIDGTAATTAIAEHGSIYINESTGQLTYTPDPDFNGTDYITVTATDNNNAVTVKTVAITVTDINDAPTLEVQSTASMDEDGGNVTLTYNAADVDGTIVSTTATVPEDQGSVVVNEDNSITFTPAENFNGDATITTVTTDDDGATATQTSTVAVSDVNDAPTLTVENTKSVDEDGSTSITFSATDIDGTIVEATATAEHGTVTVHDDNTISYVPDEDYNGTDTITVTTTDDDGTTTTETSGITVNDINDAPTLEVQSTATMGEDGGNVTLTYSAADVDGNIVSTTATIPEDQGTVIVNEDNSITFTPAENFNGEATITTVTTDDDGATATQTSTVTVSDVNDAPTLIVESTKNVDEDGSASITFSATDIDGTIVETTATAEHGTVTVNDNNTISYVPDDDYNGTDTITITTKDDDGGTTTETSSITVNDINDAPTLEVQSTASMDEDGGNVTLTYTAADVDGTIVSTTATIPEDHGSIVVNEDNSITFTPAENFNGDATITTVTTDDDGATATQTSTIAVSDVNDTPTLTVESTKNVDEDGSTSITFSATDIDGTIAETTAMAEHGTVTVNGDNTISYVPDENYNGTDTITVITTDDDGTTTTETSGITVNDINDAPTLEVQSTGSMDEDGGNVTLTYGAADVDGNIVSTTATVPEDQGTVVVNEDNSITFTPAENFNGDATITTVTTDDDGATATQTSTVAVSDVNDVPTLTVESTKIVDEDGSTSVTFSATDIDGTIVETSATAEHGTVTVNDDNTISYVPDDNYHGTDTITVNTKDDDGGTTTETSSITVNDINDAPTLEIQSTASMDEDGGNVTLTYSAADMDGNIVSTTATVPDNQGTVVVNEDNSITFTPAEDFNGDATITTVTTDNDGATATKTSTVVVNDTNEAPTASDQTLSTDEDTTITLTADNFGFSDADNESMTAVRFTSLESNGQLKLDGSDVNPAQEISRTDIDAGKLTFTPDQNEAGENYTSFSFQVSDGTDWSTDSYTTTVDVDAVADTPVVTVNIGDGISSPGQQITITEDNVTFYVFNDDGSYENDSGELDLSEANQDSEMVWNDGNGWGVKSDGEKNKDGAKTLDGNESVGMQFDSEIASVDLTLKHLKGETTSWTAYDQDENMVESGEISGPGHDADFTETITPSGNFQYLIINGNEGEKANGFYIQGATTEGPSHTEYPVTIDLSLQDSDGSESYEEEVRIEGIPVGATLSNGTQSEDGSWNVPSDQLEGLTLNLPPEITVNFNLTVSATSTESDGDTSTTTQTATVTVNQDTSPTSNTVTAINENETIPGNDSVDDDSLINSIVSSAAAVTATATDATIQEFNDTDSNDLSLNIPSITLPGEEEESNNDEEALENIQTVTQNTSEDSQADTAVATTQEDEQQTDILADDDLSHSLPTDSLSDLFDAPENSSSDDKDTTDDETEPRDNESDQATEQTIEAPLNTLSEPEAATTPEATTTTTDKGETTEQSQEVEEESEGITSVAETPEDTDQDQESVTMEEPEEEISLSTDSLSINLDEDSEQEGKEETEESSLDSFSATSKSEDEESDPLDKFSANDDSEAAEEMGSVEDLDATEEEASDQVEDAGLSADDGIQEELPQESEQVENNVG